MDSIENASTTDPSLHEAIRNSQIHQQDQDQADDTNVNIGKKRSIRERKLVNYSDLANRVTNHRNSSIITSDSKSMITDTTNTNPNEANTNVNVKSNANSLEENSEADTNISKKLRTSSFKQTKKHQETTYSIVKVVWARMPGFAPWPARVCTDIEYQHLIEKSKDKSSDHIAVMFFGSKLEKAWIPSSGIFEMTASSLLEKFIIKKFNSDKHYRLAIVEAVRLLVAKGENVDETIMDLVKNHSNDTIWTRDDVCTSCKGTELSGPALLCDICDKNETHFHCLPEPIMTMPRDQWPCKDCCIKQGFLFGKFIPYPEDQIDLSIQVDAELSVATQDINHTNSSNGAGKRKKKQALLSAAQDIAFIKKIQEERSQYSNKVDNEESNYEGEIQNNSTHVEDEVCFVCREGGNLMLCDYPDCPRVYHQVCVFHTLPHPPGYDLEACEVNDPWFCPNHFCVECFALELNDNVSYKAYPKELRVLGKDLVAKPLKQCNSCPFAVCLQCEADVQDLSSKLGNMKSSIIRMRRNSKCLECYNCMNPCPLMQLAKVLERGWLRLASSRLSIPFLHPLLPITSSIEIDDQSTNIDIITLLLRIRSLRYRNLQMFLDDIDSMREHVILKLEKFTNSKFNSEKFELLTQPSLVGVESVLDNTKESLKFCRDILSSFDTISESCKVYLLKDRHLLIDVLEAKIAGDSNAFSLETAGNECLSARLRKLLKFDVWYHSQQNEIENRNAIDNDETDSLIQFPALMALLFRQECTRSLSEVYSTKLKTLLQLSDKGLMKQQQVSPKTLELWSRFVNQGQMPALARGTLDPYSIWNNVPFNELPSNLSMTSVAQDKEEWKNFEEKVEDEIYMREYYAAKSMLSFQTSFKGETVSLLEDMYDHVDTSPWNKFSSSSHLDVQDSKILEDETLVIIDRLRDLTTKTLHLQTRLKKNYDRRQQIVATSGDMPITVGDIHIIKELKLENDNLKWQVAQRSKSIHADRVIIEDLRMRLIEAEDKLQETAIENARLLKEIDLLKKSDSNRSQEQ